MFPANVSLAQKYLESRVSSGVLSNYSLSLVAYALALANSPVAGTALDELSRRADYRGNLMKVFCCFIIIIISIGYLLSIQYAEVGYCQRLNMLLKMSLKTERITIMNSDGLKKSVSVVTVFKLFVGIAPPSGQFLELPFFPKNAHPSSEGE